MVAYSETVLRKKDDFNRVFAEPEHKAGISGIYIIGIETSLGYSRLGMVVAKKHIKKAVERNALKRRIRNHFRSSMKTISVDCVVITTAEMKSQSPDDFGKMVKSLFVQFALARDRPKDLSPIR